jgi:hypothetical protein
MGRETVISFPKLAVLGVLATLSTTASAAQSQSGVQEQNVESQPSGVLKAIFEKYNLLGTFAWDCRKPPSHDSNWYFVNRLLDADHVQRDFMIGSTTRSWAAIIDQASESKANEIAWSSIRDGQRTVGVWHVYGNRMLQWSATVNGKEIISNGKLVATGKDVPWLYRCGDSGTQVQISGGGALAQSGSVKAIFEKYNLIGTFAVNCSKPPSQKNWYYVSRLRDANRVQRDTMNGTMTRAWFSIIDTASELSPSQIAWTSIHDNGKRVLSVWHIEQDRMLLWSSIEDGKEVIGNGKSVVTGKDMPWLYRCGASDTQGQISPGGP